MTLRDDVRDYFERESRRVPMPTGLRASVTARAVAAPAATAPMTFRWAAVLAALLAVAIIAGLVAAGRLRDLFSSPTPGGHIRISSTQDARVVDVDLVDSKHGWALIIVCDRSDPGQGPCQFWTEATNDGGRSWVDAVQVGGTSLLGADSPRYVHFANRSDGFVYGLGVAFVTHDGGRSWTQLPGQVSELVAITGRSTVWAVLEPCATGATCPFEVRTSADAGRTFTRASPLPAGFVPGQAVAFGPAGLMLGGADSGDMVITNDYGRTWSSVPGRCPAGSLSNSIATPDGQELWQLCAMSEIPVLSRLFISEDAGRTWVELHGVPGNGVFASVSVQQGTFVSPQPGSIVMANAQQPIELSTDGGNTWTQVTSLGYWALIVFCSPNDGWAVHIGGEIWATTDGGRTWTKLAGQPV